MDYFTTSSQRTQSRQDYSRLLDFSPLSLPQKQHLVKVYSLLSTAVCICAGGVLFDIYVLSLPTLVSVLVALGCVLMSYTSALGFRDQKVFSWKRLCFFLGFPFFSGCSIGKFLYIVNSIDPAIIPTAFFGSVAIFTFFSLSALYAKQRSMLFLGSTLGSLACYLFFVSIFNMFYRSPLVLDIVNYLSFFLYLGYVLYDTQMIIEEFKAGSRDYFSHASKLFTNLFDIFVRLVFTLLKNKILKKEKETQ